MANTFAPNGFQPVRRLDGAAWTDQVTTRLIAANNANNFFRGDVVVLLSTGYIDRIAGSSAQTHTWDAIGVFLGCELTPGASGSPWSNTYVASGATADAKAFITMDPNVVFRVQVGTGAAPGAAGGPLRIADLGTTIPYINGTGNASSGISGAYVDYTNIAQTNTLPFTVTALVQDPPGVNGNDIATAGNVVEVVMNQSVFKVGQTGL